MKYRYVCSSITLMLMGSACSTMEQSLQLGGGLGALSGSVAIYSGYTAGGQSPDARTVAIGAGVGAAVGLITSYFTHKTVAEDRKACEADQIEMHFGDLPPSPFIVPKPQTKKGAK